MTRPRAADDFPAIRARLEELQRERAHASADDGPIAKDEQRPYAGTRPSPANRAVFPPAPIRPLARQ